VGNISPSSLEFCRLSYSDSLISSKSKPKTEEKVNTVDKTIVIKEEVKETGHG